MRRAIAVLALLLCAHPGCDSLYRGGARVGFVTSSLRLPVTLPASDLNKPLSPRDRRLLAQLDRELPQERPGAPARCEGLFARPAPPRRNTWRRRVGRRLRWFFTGWPDHPAAERFDNFSDIPAARRHTVVMVCISGGGARAASLARHVMAQLEDAYNAVNPCPQWPLIDSIDVYSTVSGGSIFVSHIATQHLAPGRSVLDHERRACADSSLPAPQRDERWRRFLAHRRHLLRRVVARRRKGTAHLGLHASLSAMEPVTFTTCKISDMSYLDVLAVTLRQTYYGPWHLFTSTSHGYQLGHLAKTPRFLFNATCMESGTPCVLTQSMMHLPSEQPPLAHEPSEPPEPSVPQQRPVPCRRPSVPLSDALTLEDFNSSPAKLSLAYAAMTSAAFPILQDPLPFRKFNHVPTSGAVVPSDDLLHLTDGGVYDNSGLDSAVDVFEFLVRARGVKRLVLLQISALHGEYDRRYGTRIGAPYHALRNLAPPHPWPVRGTSSAARALLLTHYLNERRAEKAALDRLEKLTRDCEGVDYLYFPVSLAQLSPRHAYSVQANEKLYQRVRSIATDYTIGPSDDRVLAQVTALLLTAPRPPASPGGRPRMLTKAEEPAWGMPKLHWPVGPQRRPVRRLDHAFAYAVIRAHQPRWHDPIPPRPSAASSKPPVRTAP